MADRIKPLLDAWEKTIKAAFLEAVRGIRDRVHVAELIELLKAGDVEGAIRVVGMDRAAFRALDRAIEAAYEAGGIDANVGIGLRIAPFDLRAASADAWLRSHTTDLIRQITEEQRESIRITLAPLADPTRDPMLTGDTPHKLALDLVGRVSKVTGSREGGALGLTSQQAEWARNYETELRSADPAALSRKLRDKRFDAALRKAIKTGEPIPAEKVQTMVAAYRNRTLRYRAETIALNEASTALHASQVQAWDQAVANGVVAESKVRRHWITAADDHVRPSHRAVPGLNKDGVGLHAPFQTYKGPVMQPGWSFDPGCRCRVRVKVIED